MLYENGRTLKKTRTFPDRAALDEFLADQATAMTHAGWRAERGDGHLHLYPPTDSLSDGTWLSWNAAD
ncbi:MAG: hypothetical protein ABR616_15800 [Dermatophilaceae bacterium]|nr:hypothetical protein [Intrasporangiaceae bacterium]